MATAYEWVESRGLGIDATLVGRYVERIAKRGGGICSPAAYVEAARDETSALHDTLEWDDEVAAEAHRRQQARMILRNLRVVGAANQDLPAFVHVRVEAGEGYVASTELETNADYQQFALDDALSRLNAVRRRYQALKELSEVWAALEKVAA